MGSPVSTISIALNLPTALVNLTVPPAPGMTPSLISGYPNLALSEAIIISHIMASSSPPPKAIPLTAAIRGFLNLGTILNHSLSKWSLNKWPVYPCSPISLILAPTAKDGEPILPVRITTDTEGFYSRERRSSEICLIKGFDKKISFEAGVISSTATEPCMVIVVMGLDVKWEFRFFNLCIFDYIFSN